MEDRNYTHYLKNEFEMRLAKNPSYSLRAYSKYLEIDPGTLSQVLSGKKILSIRSAQKIAWKLSFAPDQRKDFLELLSARHEKRNLKRKSPALKMLLKQKPKKPVSSKDISLEHFKVMSEWYYAAILELTFCTELVHNNAQVAKRLGINEFQAKFAVECLLELGLIESQNGILKKKDKWIETQDKHLTTSAHKKRQKQVLEKSIEALENSSIEKRNHTAMTMAIDPALIPEAKKRIQDFTVELMHFLESGKRKEVYELSISLFSLEKESL